MNANEKYKIAIADYLDMKPEQVTLFWKGRVALYGLLKTLGVGKDDEVIVPGFTCVVVPNAIMYLGAKPVYADINPETYNIDIEQVEEKLHRELKC